MFYDRRDLWVGEPKVLQEMREELDAWLADRNATCARIDWHFTAEDARIKLKRLYPVFS